MRIRSFILGVLSITFSLRGRWQLALHRSQMPFRARLRRMPRNFNVPCRYVTTNPMWTANPGYYRTIMVHSQTKDLTKLCFTRT
jgi:hypothetical protein